MTLSGWLIAWRSLRRRPAFFLATLLILSLGIAANTAVFSVVDATLLKPLPYADPDRLVAVMEGSPNTGREGLIAPGRLVDWNRLSRTFAAISGSYSENVTDTSGPEPERGALAMAQIALTFLLLSGAGLMLRTYENLSHSDPGFEASRAITFHVGAGWDEDRTRIGHLQEDILDKLSALPGVEAVGFANFLPASGATLRFQYTFGDQPAFTAGERSVTRDYFKAVGMPLEAGESCPAFRAVASAPPQALVNRRFVQQFMNGENPIGRTFTITGGQRPYEISGVVGDAREDALNTAPVPYVYLCFGPGNWPDPEYVVRTTADPARLFAQIRAAVHEIAPKRAIFGLATLADVVDATLDQPKLDAQMIAFFAVAALLLAGMAVGLIATIFARRAARVDPVIAIRGE
jgi:hypothetical protein